MENVLREDAPEKCLSNEEALKNTKHKEKGFFKGPRAS
ncbi:MAG: Asp-tRNA(Asn)/Glu-tRNA(Gln) amidotransferase subunit GatC [Candidatus Aenigmatarchaeota archaeon]